MKSEVLLTMFEHSACLSRRQLKDYATGLMVVEEAHAVETHLNGCPLCSDAVDGLQKAAHAAAATDALHALNDNFLKDHFGWHHPEVHLNTMTPAAHMVSGRNRQKKIKAKGFRTSPSLTLFVLILLGLIWYVQSGRHNFSRSQQLTREAAAKEAEEHTAAKPIEEQNTIVAAPMQTEERSVKPAVQDVETPPATTGSVPANATVANPAAPAEQTVSVSKKELAQPRHETWPLKTNQGAKLPVTVKEYEPVNKEITTALPVHNISNMDKAKALYDKQQYQSALKLYKQELNSADKKTRQQAGLMIADIYEKTGQKAKAKASLETVMEDGGKEKRQAKRMLKEIQAEEMPAGLQDDER